MMSALLFFSYGLILISTLLYSYYGCPELSSHRYVSSSKVQAIDGMGHKHFPRLENVHCFCI